MSYPCDSDSYHMDRVPDKCICKYKPAFVVTCIKGTSALNCHLLRTSNPEYSTNELLLTVVCHKHPHFMDSWGEPLIQVCIYIKSYFLIVLKKKKNIHPQKCWQNGFNEESEDVFWRNENFYWRTVHQILYLGLVVEKKIKQPCMLCVVFFLSLNQRSFILWMRLYNNFLFLHMIKQYTCHCLP